jgi:hypothetical protein
MGWSGNMGWSGYESRFHVSFLVDAHGGEKEERGELLYEECVERITTAIKEIVSDPAYAEIKPCF